MIEYGTASLEDINERLFHMSHGYHRAAGRTQLSRYQATRNPDHLRRAQEHARLGTLVDTAIAAFDARGPLPYKQGKAAGQSRAKGKRSAKPSKK